MNPNFYASVFNIYLSARDCKIVFADVNPIIDDKGQITDQQIAERQTITMPLITAKELVKILDGQIKLYEKQFGEILNLIPQETPISKE